MIIKITDKFPELAAVGPFLPIQEREWEQTLWFLNDYLVFLTSNVGSREIRSSLRIAVNINNVKLVEETSVHAVEISDFFCLSSPWSPCKKQEFFCYVSQETYRDLSVIVLKNIKEKVVVPIKVRTAIQQLEVI